MKKTLLLLALVSYLLGADAQETFPYNGIKDERTHWYAITGLTVIPSAGQEIANATVVIKDGRIVSMVPDGEVPDGAIAMPGEGHYLYPSFVELYADYGLPAAKPAGKRPQKQPQMWSNKEGAYAWNEALKPEFRAAAHFVPDEQAAAKWRKMGFGVVLTHQTDGISRGSAAAVSVGKERAHELILSTDAAHYLSFRKGVSTQNNPNSLMGIIALLRQTYLDGAWYQSYATETNLSLAAWNDLLKLPQIFAVEDWQEALRALELGGEFEQNYIIKGSGDEYQRLDAIKSSGATFILPLNFPDAYELSDPYLAHQLSLTQLRHWEMAPANAALLSKAGVPIVLSSVGHDKPKEFLSAVRKAIEHGLSPEAALRALTESPAQLLGLEQEIGTLANGKRANFLLTSGPLFATDTKLRYNFIDGQPYELAVDPTQALVGTYELQLGDRRFPFELKADGKGTIDTKTDTSLPLSYKWEAETIHLSFPLTKGGKLYRLTGLAQGDTWAGRGYNAEGEWTDWEARRKGTQQKPTKQKEDATKAPSYLSQTTYPYGAYGWKTLPSASTVLFRNATLWTNENTGIMEGADLLIQDGKIVQIGKSLTAPKGASIVDATGKHLTPGIIDEHSHIAISRGVNEGSQESTAEVRIGDVIDATDIDIYRQLAGGVTTSQLLHGSANPIGGQSAIIKLRWGLTDEEMKFTHAPGFIKFALGENVKQSNWGDNNTIRYPQTRMGVEQVFVNYFTEARAYGEALRSGKPLRRNLELEALLEVLEGQRFVTCHSYQQGEITMLMRVAERFGFTLNTFTHILEGYKVADKMAAHGAGGSSFSDWWAYKYEVIEAIPYNGALMHEQGVTVAFNSDDAEMARRLNQEAAKAILFGGLSEEEAFKFVTLNPAKLLHIDDRVGSLRVGKDADLVLWTDHPLSIYARAEQTYVDGIKYYDMIRDQQLRKEIRAEREALIQKMLQAKARGAETQQPTAPGQEHYHCDTDHDEG
ncbi:MAG: amidohydrolase [Bacteroidetes bacterium]|nr:MAG: amidohydrolase [Bacteroidota bacterium]